MHERTLENLHRQQLVEVQGQTDVLVFGLPYVCPYNVNSILNPILVHCLGLGYLFNMYRNKPLVKPGGVVIMFHPVPWEFHQIRHPSYIDFFEEVLRETTDPATLESKYEGSATRPTRGTRICTARATPTTVCTRSTCGIGGRTGATTRAT